MLKAVFFDWDGTLCNSIPNIEKTYRKVEKELGLNYPYEKFRLLIGVPTSVQAALVLPDNPQHYIDYYREAYSSNDPDPIYEGADRAVEAIKAMGPAIVLVTSKTRSNAVAALRNHGMYDYFDLLVCGDEVAHPKPDPEPVQIALDRLGLAPDEAVYVGDSFQDLQSARGAGLRVISVTWGARYRNELETRHPEFLADNWQELKAAVRELLSYK